MTRKPGAYPAPPGATSRRLEWAFLPPHLRAYVERRCGSPVVEAISQTSGFTPGFASVLVCEDGSRHFVKAASVKAQRMFADSYREEGRKLAALPASVPAPRLLWMLDDDWVVLGIEHVEAGCPEPAVATGRPRRDPGRAGGGRGRADPGADGAGHLRRASSPRSSTAGRTSAPCTTCRTSTRPRHWPGGTPRSARATPSCTPTSAPTTCSSTPPAKAWLVDWNWPVAGAPWLDSLFTLIGPRGDGLDVDAVIASRRLLRDVPAEAVDIVLALVIGLLPVRLRPARPAHVAVPPRAPALAGRGLLGLAGRAARLVNRPAIRSAPGRSRHTCHRSAPRAATCRRTRFGRSRAPAVVSPLACPAPPRTSDSVRGRAVGSRPPVF